MKIDRSHYIGLSVIYSATLKYSSYRENAKRIVRGNFLTSRYALDEIESVYPRRHKVYSKIISDITPREGINPLIGKMVIDFLPCFRIGATGHYNDDAHFEDMFYGILGGIGLDPTDKLNEETALKFQREALSAIRNNRAELGMIRYRLKNEPLLLEIQEPSMTDKLYRKIRKHVSKSSKYKIDLKIISECIIDAVSTGMESVIISSDDNFFEDSAPKKILKEAMNVLRIPTIDFIELKHISKSYI